MEKSSLGMDANVAAGLAVLFSWVSGLVLYLTETKSAFVKFYALQSIVLAVVAVVANVAALILVLVLTFSPVKLPGLVAKLLYPLINTGAFIFWLIMLVNAFTGKAWELPFLGSWCRQQVGLGTDTNS